jgi:3-phenylpropionate/trans-cinnamate dioxygenase ferredoxin subunit
MREDTERAMVHYVTEPDQIPEGQHRLFEIAGRSIGIYNLKGTFYAVLNYCPHQGAELCKGQVCGTTIESEVYEYKFGRDGEIVRCPWHGWEFDLKTGKALAKERVRLRTFKVVIEEGKIGVIL